MMQRECCLQCEYVTEQIQELKYRVCGTIIHVKRTWWLSRFETSTEDGEIGRKLSV